MMEKRLREHWKCLEAKICVHFIGESIVYVIIGLWGQGNLFHVTTHDICV